MTSPIVEFINLFEIDNKKKTSQIFIMTIKDEKG